MKLIFINRQAAFDFHAVDDRMRKRRMVATDANFAGKLTQNSRNVEKSSTLACVGWMGTGGQEEPS
ncbi:hypothetical protein [Rhizobium sp. NLR22b]|uniref:hypothetical protein n=1 Tax=Rhizobium sp. NLR22b TaxID=2731115 RepID=UPI001C830EE3|nr:hypothetical protein [Rhizobium sp. NLR22b]MBX5237847.1 hypothetical protein [Rhizobium sp. NLR22b]